MNGKSRLFSHTLMAVFVSGSLLVAYSPSIAQSLPIHLQQGGGVSLGWIWLVVICTSIWVLVDASNIGARKGLIKGVADMGPFAWFVCSLLLWIIAFPMYLAKRGAIKAAAQSSSAPAAQRASMPPPVTEPTNLKNCPFCAEPIRAEAIKCKHCSSDLSAKA